MRRSAMQRRVRRRRRIRRVFLALVVLAAAASVVLDHDTLGLDNGHGSGSTPASNSSQSTTPEANSSTVTKVQRPKVESGAPAGYATALAPAAVRERVIRDLKGSVIDKQQLTSGLLFDVRSGHVLWSKRPTDVLPIASLTKLMTALVVTAHSKPSDRVLITKQAVDFTGSGIGLLPRGKYVPELALLYGLLLPSGNDAAIALAQHVGHHQPQFISMMNQHAREMGMTCTHYTTVSGVIDQGNHSCAENLAVIAHAVLHNRLLAHIVGSPHAVVKFPIKGGKLWLYNNNPLYAAGYAGTDGVKTGYTTKAGMCLIATVKRGSRWLGIVLLHSANWETQAEALLNAGFAAT